MPNRRLNICKQLVFFGLLIVVTQIIAPPIFASAQTARFKPLSGYLVQVDSAGIVIDCGQQKGVASGDLFTVLAPGKPLMHPVTGQALGTRERLLAVLKVTRVAEDYAICSPLKRYLRVPIKAGSPVKRFASMAALFIDFNGNGIEVFSHLREALPQLNWADYKTGLKLQQTLHQPGGPGSLGYDLYVVNKGHNLTIYNSDNELVRAMNASSLSPYSNLVDQPGKSSSHKNKQGKYTLSTTNSEKAILTRYRQIAKLNLVVKGMSIGELDNDGKPEIIFTDGEQIYVYQLSELGLKFCYRYHFDKWGSIVNLQVGDITGDHIDEIMVNTFKESEDGFSSFVIAKDRGKYRIVADNIPFIMGLLGGRSIADKGVYFVGQGFAEGEFYDHLVSRLQFKPGSISSHGKFTVPTGFTLPGAVYDDINNDRIKELCFINKQNYLEIYQGSKRLWVSDERVAGSLQNVQYEVGTQRVSYTEKRQINSPLIVHDINNNGIKELLLIDNKSDMSTSLGEYGFLSHGHIKMLRSNGDNYIIQKMTGHLSGPVQGLQIVNNELICAMVKRGDDLMKLSGSTYLLAFPLAQR